MNNLKILTIRNAKFSGYYFYVNLNIWGDFQFCIGVTLIMSKNILNCRVVGARQSFQIFRQNFLENNFVENNRALSKFLYGILYYLISIIKL